MWLHCLDRDEVLDVPLPKVTLSPTPVSIRKRLSLDLAEEGHPESPDRDVADSTGDAEISHSSIDEIEDMKILNIKVRNSFEDEEVREWIYVLFWFQIISFMICSIFFALICVLVVPIGGGWGGWGGSRWPWSFRYFGWWWTSRWVGRNGRCRCDGWCERFRIGVRWR